VIFQSRSANGIEYPVGTRKEWIRSLKNQYADYADFSELTEAHCEMLLKYFYLRAIRSIREIRVQFLYGI
jgi:hypothetical protein